MTVAGIRTCPTCRDRVLPSADDICPACRQYKFVGAPEESLPPVRRPGPPPGIDPKRERERRDRRSVTVVVVVALAATTTVALVSGLSLDHLTMWFWMLMTGRSH